jgi:hypothetical protein
MVIIMADFVKEAMKVSHASEVLVGEGAPCIAVTLFVLERCIKCSAVINVGRRRGDIVDLSAGVFISH